MKLRKIVEMIRGTKGSEVKLLIQPADATDSSARKEIIDHTRYREVELSPRSRRDF